MTLVRLLKRHSRKAALGAVLLFLVGLASLTPTHAAINKQVNFQGRLTDASGNVVPDGSYNIEFKLHSSSGSSGGGQGACTGDCLWRETRTGANVVTVSRGLFSVQLGEVTSLSSFNFNQDPLYLSVRIGGTGTPAWDTEMTPRHRLGAAPQAIEADHATTADTATNAGNSTTVGGYTPGNASGNIPISNGTLSTNLNADLLDGQHGAYYQNGSNINSGTVGSSYLPGTVAYTNVANTFSQQQTFATGTASAPGLQFSGGQTVGLTTGTSGGTSDDALRAVANNAGAGLQVQNRNASGFSGVEYLSNAGSVSVFTGLNNNNGQEFRFNNIASGGYINFLIGGGNALNVANNTYVGLGLAGASSRLGLSGSGTANGITLGDGAANSVNLYRSAADTLSTDDKVVVGVTSSNKDQITISDTTAGAGITIGGDTNVYRVAADVLKTDDTFQVGLNIFSQVGSSAQILLGAGGPSGQAGLRFGSAEDTNLYRSAADTLKTDDSLIVGSSLYVGSTDVKLDRGAADRLILAETAGAGVNTGFVFNSTTGSVFGRTAAGNLGLALGGDTNLYRSAADVLKSDDALQLGTSAATPGSGGDLAISRNSATTQGWAYFGSGGNFFGYDGTQFSANSNLNLGGNTLTLGSGNSQINFNAGSEYIYWGSGAGGHIFSKDIGVGFGSGTAGRGCIFNNSYTIMAGTCASDENLKKDIKTADSVFDRFAQLNVVNYRLRPEKNPGASDQVVHTGVVAQEIEKLFPELVVDDKETGIKRVDYSTLELYNLNATRELVNRVKELELQGSSSSATTVLSAEAQTIKELKVAETLQTKNLIVEEDLEVKGDLTLSDNSKGANVSVKKGERKMEIRFGKAQRDSNYTVQLTPSWVSAYGVTTKTADGFTVEFDKKAPKDAKLDWTVLR